MLKPCKSVQDSSAESANSLKLDSYLTDSYLSRFNEAQQILSIEVSIKVTGIHIFRSDFWPMLMYLCRVSFLTTLDIHKAYFGGRHIREYKGKHMQKVTNALFSLKEAIASFAP